MRDLVQEMGSPVHALFTGLGDRDLYSAEHCKRTTALATELGRRCGLSDHQLDLLLAAASVHDIGKIGIPDSVLLKRGRLTSKEWTVMKTHAEIGSNLLAVFPVKDMDQVVAAVRHHHEGFDGKGYPDGLAGESIPVMARIISLADAYDAMATTRPYQQARDHGSIMEILHGENGGHYDPWMRDKFTQLIERSPYRADRILRSRHAVTSRAIRAPSPRSPK